MLSDSPSLSLSCCLLIAPHFFVVVSSSAVRCAELLPASWTLSGECKPTSSRARNKTKQSEDPFVTGPQKKGVQTPNRHQHKTVSNPRSHGAQQNLSAEPKIVTGPTQCITQTVTSTKQHGVQNPRVTRAQPTRRCKTQISHELH